jgi:hypothetical protein
VGSCPAKWEGLPEADGFTSNHRSKGHRRMLTWEGGRGGLCPSPPQLDWTISAMARHLGLSRNTVRAYVRGERRPGERRRPAPDPLAL